MTVLEAEEILLGVYEEKYIIRLMEEVNKAFPALKKVTTEVYLWDGHRTKLINTLVVSSKDLVECKTKSLQQALIKVLRGELE